MFTQQGKDFFFAELSNIFREWRFGFPTANDYIISLAENDPIAKRHIHDIRSAILMVTPTE